MPPDEAVKYFYEELCIICGKAGHRATTCNTRDGAYPYQSLKHVTEGYIRCAQEAQTLRNVSLPPSTHGEILSLRSSLGSVVMWRKYYFAE
uniref:CCHC-type domain-containing protein n=1 Tax=Physcomitrium patens TaxID=3218 RepID=A0A2K1JCF7_PHYPA|nr:hypothetical protein PHYPA_019493 [Physcomitrium patens]